MFGTNKILKQELGHVENVKLWVQEVFYTIQGEGPFQGTPAVFIRLAGCNLRCFFCDTDFESSGWTPDLDELLEKIEEVAPPSCRLIVLTGGEPLRQNIIPLLDALYLNHYHVQIETAGTLWIAGLEDHIAEGEATLVCSPKTGKVHESVVENCYDWKYIVSEQDSDPEDGLPVMSTQAPGVKGKVFRPNMDRVGQTIWVQPMEAYSHFSDAKVQKINERLLDPRLAVTSKDYDQTFKNMQFAAQLAMKHGYRLSIQQHKILGLP